MNTNEVNQNGQNLQDVKEPKSEFLKVVLEASKVLLEKAEKGKGLGFILIGVETKETDEKTEVMANSAVVGSGKVLIDGLRAVLKRKDVPVKELVMQAAKENMLSNLFGK